jgi:signal transduction histidine kinase
MENSGVKNSALNIAASFPSDASCPTVTLESQLKQGPTNLSNAVTFSLSLLSALKEIHDQGIIHGNLQPSNILIEGRDPVEKVMLDNVAVPLRLQSVQAIRYVSPEQAGILNHPVDRRSDLYSAGIILYEYFSGNCPFSGETISEVLREHLTTVPPPLSHLGNNIPLSLNEVIHHLLEKDVSDRYQTADAVIEDLSEIAEAIKNGDENAPLAIGKRDRRSTLTEPAFIGRNSDVLKLDSSLREAARGHGALILLEAESGGGKTRLLQEFSKRNQENLVAWGQGLDQGAKRPFHLLVGIADCISKFTEKSPDTALALRAQLGDYANAITTVLPELKNLLPPVSEELGPEGFGEIRSLEALTKLIEAMGTAERPALLLLDDCQWADNFTLQLLNHWQERRTNTESQSYTMIVAAFRSEEVSPGHLLRSIQPQKHIVLLPLDKNETSNLILSMAGPVPEEVLTTVYRLSEGSPFMTSAILRGLVESQILVFRTNGWEIDPLHRKSLQSSRHAAQFLMRRIEILPEGVLQLLSAGAVLGKEFSVPFAAMLVGQMGYTVGEFVLEAKRRHIIWLNETDNLCTFVHDKLRDSFLTRLSPESRKALHLRAAEYLERNDSKRIFEIAFHFDASGNSQRALSFALASAKQARAQSSLEVAEQQYRIAARGVDKDDTGTCKSIFEGLGEILLLRGHYEEAEEYFRAVLNLASNNLDKAQVKGKLGELAFKRGNVGDASKSVEEGLRLLGKYVPRNNLMFTALTLWEVFVQVLHTLFPFILGLRRSRQKNVREFHAIQLLSRLAYIYWFERGKIPCAWAHLKEMNSAERYEPGGPLAQAYSEHAPVMTMMPYFSRAIAYAKKSFAIRKKIGDLWGQGQSLHFHGVALYAASRFEEAIEKCRDAAHLLEKTGDRWEMNTANWHIGFSLYRLGRDKEAIEIFRYVYQEGLRIGDHQASAISLSGWSKASNGSVPAELIRTELERNTGDKHTAMELYQGEAIRLLRQEDFVHAIRILYKAQKMVATSGFQSEYIAPILCWLSTSLRLQSEKEKLRYSPRRWKKVFRELEIISRKALKVAFRYKNNLPHALRENAYVFAMKGNGKKAKRMLEESERIARQQGASAELTLTLKARSKLGEDFGWRDTGQVSVPTADALKPSKVESEKRVTISLIDRFDKLISTGRKITTSLSSEEIYLEARKGLLELLRAEQCYLMKWDEEKQTVIFSDSATNVNYSKDMAEKSLHTGKTEIFVENHSEKDSESMYFGEVRSALCAPFFIRGKKAGCFYLIHNRVGALFGEEEVRLAEFVATLAGAALENAEGFAELHRLNHNLNDRMEEQKRVEAELKNYATRLRRSNSDLEQFAYVASHDLKEPLRMVTSYVQILSKEYHDKLDSEANEYIKFAVEGVSRMYELIEALLAYSQAGRTDDALTEVDFNQVFLDAKANLKSRIEDEQAEVIAEPLPTLRADKIQVTQLFQNLIGNALKFKSEKAIKVVVSVEKLEGFWKFMVKDNGIGIDPKYAERIFIIFQRLHQREKYPGTGIGLAICKKTVQQLGGQIWVESKLGEGSTFCFTLPINESTGTKYE